MRRARIIRSKIAFALAAAPIGVFTAGFVVRAALSTKALEQSTEAGLAVLGLLVIVLSSRLGVRVESGGVRIVNVFSRPRFRWAEIERFEVAPAGRYPYAGHAILTSGRDVAITGITAPPFFAEHFKHTAQEPIDELNALLRRATGEVDAVAAS